MEIYVALAITALLIGHAILIVSCLLLRARSLEQDSDMRSVHAAIEQIGQTVRSVALDPSQHIVVGAVAAVPRTEAPPSSVIAPVTYPDDMEIPAALVGERCKQTIERFAPALGTTPVNLLREALAQGLTGGRPVTEEMLDMLEEEAKAMELSSPSKPGRSRLS
jgi:hypothetical protein